MWRTVGRARADRRRRRLSAGYGPVTWPPGLATAGHGSAPCGVKTTTPLDAPATTPGDAAWQWACAQAFEMGPLTTASLPGGVTVWEWAATGIAMAASRARAATDENSERFMFLLLQRG